MGKDFLEGSIGSSGIMYCDMYGYDIHVVTRDSGGKLYKPQYNMHAHGVHLLLTRSDQFVYGRLNEGDTRNMFEFGDGFGSYQRMREDSDSFDDAHNDESYRKNGFSYGYLFGINNMDANDKAGRYPSFKVESGNLFFGHEHTNKRAADFSVADRMLFIKDIHVDPNGEIFPEGRVLGYTSQWLDGGSQITPNLTYSPFCVSGNHNMEAITATPLDMLTSSSRALAIGIVLKKADTVGDLGVSPLAGLYPVAVKGGPYRVVIPSLIPTHTDPNFPRNWRILAVRQSASTGVTPDQTEYSVFID